MVATKSVALDAPRAEDESSRHPADTAPIRIEAAGLPELPPLTVEQAEELWEELSQILSR